MNTTPATTNIYLLRHAESAPSAELPEPDWPLSETGFQQAENLVQTLSGLSIDKVFSSPFLRARQTIEPFCARFNLHLEVETDLRERKLQEDFVGDWKELLEKSWQDFSFSLPKCESGFDCQNRIVSCVNEIVSVNEGNNILLTSHGNAIGLFLNSLDNTFGHEEWKNMKNPDLFRISYMPEGFHWDKDFIFRA